MLNEKDLIFGGVSNVICPNCHINKFRLFWSDFDKLDGRNIWLDGYEIGKRTQKELEKLK